MISFTIWHCFLIDARAATGLRSKLYIIFFHPSFPVRLQTVGCLRIASKSQHSKPAIMYVPSFLFRWSPHTEVSLQGVICPPRPV
ncbi:hypothetical protein HD806DRAFT_509929 [Xylariaceae sp. AK1471]|nr:hypothetical protein HD806DRAFT_509929 [Xylariaceae sp. AK1471]